jgi:hypothetical protein
MTINYFISEDRNLGNLYKKLILWFKEKQSGILTQQEYEAEVASLKTIAL